MSLFDALRRIPRSFSAASLAEAAAGRPVCEVRGYCGPFTNQAFYNSLATWQGFGDCVECGRAVPVPRESPRALSWMAEGTALSEPPPSL